MENWSIRPLIYSGRENPEIGITQAQSEMFLSLWMECPLSQQNDTTPPKLGYNGIQVIMDQNKICTVKNGFAILKEGDYEMVRKDTGVLEKFLIDLLPEVILKQVQLCKLLNH